MADKTEMLDFRKGYTTKTMKPYKEEFEQAVPEVGLVFSIKDGGWGWGRASAYIVTGLGPLNKYNLPKKVFARELHKTRTPKQLDTDDGKYTISEDGKQCLVNVGGLPKEFPFRLRNGELYYKGALDYLLWGEIREPATYPI